jgi:hypothetical protein
LIPFLRRDGRERRGLLGRPLAGGPPDALHQVAGGARGLGISVSSLKSANVA